LATRYCKIIRGSLELPILDGQGNPIAWPGRITVSEGELVDLEEGLADRLALAGVVEILPST
jgi:hypothetical protein